VGSREWAKEGVSMDPKKLLPSEGLRPFLPRRWVVERTLSWLSENRRMSLWITRGYPRKFGSVHLRGYEPPYGQEIGPLMRVFRQFHYALGCISHPGRVLADLR
jgi:hypothetical protein